MVSLADLYKLDSNFLRLPPGKCTRWQPKINRPACVRLCKAELRSFLRAKMPKAALTACDRQTLEIASGDQPEDEPAWSGIVKKTPIGSLDEHTRSIHRAANRKKRAD
jgi:hypothetical protein